LAKRADANQPEIVKELEKMGCSVLHLHTVGKGCPDLAVAFRGMTYLVEIKNGKRYWEMSPAQDKFRSEWNAPVILIDSVESASNWVRQLTDP
jgi:hypothetical protein